MDIDVPQPTRNSPFISFFDVSNKFPFQEPCPDAIRQRRSDMMDGLLFDVLLMSGGIMEPYLVYPPEDVNSLQRLLDAIESSTYDTLKKDCLVYFLLKWHQDGRERTFQQQRCIPPQFAALSDAYWHLDTGIHVPRAVAILSDARLNRDYASKIMHAISLTKDSAPLIRRYVQTAKPLLIEPLDIECYTLALAELGVLEAWQFSRTFNEADPMRARLLKKIIEWSVEPAPRPVALSQLITLPLSTFEESVFTEFVQKPSPTLNFSGVAILQDLVCVRLIQGGRYNEAIKIDRQFTSTTLPQNLQLTKDRSKMVHDIYSCLPPIERAMIELELDPTTVQKAPLMPKALSPIRKQAPVPAERSADTSLSQSWEDVRMPGVVSVVSAQTTPLRDVHVPSATPNFGGVTSLHSSASTAPIIPVNFNGVASGSKTAPRKSLPLSSSVFGLPAKVPRASLSGVGSRMAFGGGSPVVASPASGMRVPLLGAGAAPSPSPAHNFVSAVQQQNAFYTPPAQKTNGVKRAFEEDTSHSPERPGTMNVDLSAEIEMGDQTLRYEEMETHEEPVRAEETIVTPTSNGRRRGRISAATEEPEDDEANVLQYSVFRASEEPERSPPRSQPQRASRRKAPPGSYAPSEDEDAMDEDNDERRPRKATRARTSGKTVQQEAPAKPPAKKARQTKEKDLSRTIPGGFGDENEHTADEEDEEDHVAPLRAPSPPRRGARKVRASLSVDSAVDEGEGVRTRRRSSRLTMTGSVHEGSPEPVPAPKPKKTTRTTKKKKN